MSTAVSESPEPKAASTPLASDSHAVMLRGVAWETYLKYCDESENGGVRMYYSEGGLLLMTTGPMHERITRLLERLVIVWGEENDEPVMSFGHWTLQNQLKQKPFPEAAAAIMEHYAEGDMKVVEAFWEKAGRN